ncbi:MAG: MoaD/ThiS family protein [Rhodospirillales bacterium]|nr:MoaD/ThiS family protein [Rhodospirillales bacterium]
MPVVAFTSALRRFLPVPTVRTGGVTVAEALAEIFAGNPPLRGYLLDDQGALRRHVAVYVGAAPIADRARQSDPVAPDEEIHVFQALTGG